ncbi:MAG: FliI/YscN family ATPase [Desulfobacterales bacterium]
MSPLLNVDKYHQALETLTAVRASGRVLGMVGLVIESQGPPTALGGICTIYPKGGRNSIKAEVLGFKGQRVLLQPLEDIRGIGPGSLVVAEQPKAFVHVGDSLLGRVVDGLGVPIDGKGSLNCHCPYPIYATPTNPLARRRIQTALATGVRAIDGLLTVGHGQRLGIFAGSGVGKSVLLGMIARRSSADVNVIALIGERGREVNEFIEGELGPEGLARSVVVVATSDRLPLIRMRGAFIATTIAEYFRDQGLNVNLMMDSVTRFAMAQREVGLALGEPPTSRGYTPSVFALLPQLLERAGTRAEQGSITGLYTVLVEGGDMDEPVADAVRGILDGHIVLSRDLAIQNHYPAIDVLQSVSRVMGEIVDPAHQSHAGRLKSILATYRKSEDLINIGAYVAGSNPAIDEAVNKIDAINRFLCQPNQESTPFDESLERMAKLIR